jgi:uncharacterized ferritin-like protein (DUF455 family)
MELREFALRIVTTDRLEEKLSPPPPGMPDEAPGPATRVESPGRPAELKIVSAREGRVPSIGGLHDPEQRKRIIHSFANHELQAAELFAWALLAFPEAPREFRRGLLAILDDEQRHTRMYIARLREWELPLGAYPVTGYFWSKTPAITTPVRFVCAMSLTFENANLDHTVEYADAAERIGDPKTARLLRQVHLDEIEHVRFGWKWLQRFKKEADSAWETYRRNVAWPLRPALARGATFHPESRAAAGLDPETIQGLEQASRDAGQEDEC